MRQISTASSCGNPRLQHLVDLGFRVKLGDLRGDLESRVGTEA